MTNDTLLHRQVNPTWIQQGRVTSQLFTPTSKDKDFVSVYDGDQITAEGAFSHFTNTLGLKSMGVMAVTVQECIHYELEVKPDPAAFAEHTAIVFSGFTKSQIVTKAKKLKEAAVSRGWQYQFDN